MIPFEGLRGQLVAGSFEERRGSAVTKRTQRSLYVRRYSTSLGLTPPLSSAGPAVSLTTDGRRTQNKNYGSRYLLVGTEFPTLYTDPWTLYLLILTRIRGSFFPV
jgi:hypothetical protein